jgi:hypothetical protein
VRTLACAFDAITDADGLAVPEVSFLLLSQAFVAVVLQMRHFPGVVLPTLLITLAVYWLLLSRTIEISNQDFFSKIIEQCLRT